MKLVPLLPLLNYTAPATSLEPRGIIHPKYDCHYHYGFNKDTLWFIRGTDFDRGLLGKMGTGLLERLRGCANVEQWGFDWEDAHTFLATGFYRHKPVPDWCIVKALKDVGAGDGQCIHRRLAYVDLSGGCHPYPDSVQPAH